MEDRIARLETAVRRQRFVTGALACVLAVTLIGAATQPSRTQPNVVRIAGPSISGITIQDEILYRVRADGVVEQQAIGTRRAALAELQRADRTERVPGLRWQPLNLPE